MDERETLRCSIWDPTGNITALVESAVAVDRQPSVAAALMRRHPEVEQVGFVRPAAPGGDLAGELRMAGGEFCGNASMCAAALFRLRGKTEDAPETVWVRVSGVSQPVPVRLRQEGAESFHAAVRMGAPLSVAARAFGFEGLAGSLPLVEMEGISHLLVEPGSPFRALLRDREAAGRAVRAWCAGLGAACLGLLFLEGDAPAYRLTPLVHVPGSGTVFWESACASGSAAVGMALAARTGSPVCLELCEPGGTLRVESEPGGETWLCGRTRLLARYGAAD